MTFGFTVRAWLYIIVLLVSGCATIPPGTCEHFEHTRKSMRYDTVYRYSETDTRNAKRAFASAARAEPVTVRWYTVRLNRAQIGQCDHLYLTKELYLQRTTGTGSTLEEQREIYIINDRLIATKREDVTPQLSAGGFYSAVSALPIPAETPGGAYKIVSRLVARNGKQERTLATATVEFRVQR